MPETLPQTSFVREMFESVERLFNAGLIDNGNEPKIWLKKQRSTLYSRLLKSPPAKRLLPDQIRKEAEKEMLGCLFVFYGYIEGSWVLLATKTSPQSANASSLFTSDDIYLDADGWFYSLKHKAIRLGIYKP